MVGVTLDSKVFFEIPRQDLDTNNYRRWLENEIIRGWLMGEGNTPPIDTGPWNQEGGMYGFFGGEYKVYCKLYKFDGSIPPCNPEKPSWSNLRGVLMRDHYSEEDVEKVQNIANRFEALLKEHAVDYRRENISR